MSGIRRLVVDVLIPNNLPIEELSLTLSELSGIEGVDILIQEVERKVQAAKITIEGTHIDFEAVKNAFNQMGASLQSVDRVTTGKRIVG
jgi:uncharacterized protein